MKNKLRNFIIIMLCAIILPVNAYAKESINIIADKSELNNNDSVTLMVDLDYNEPLYSFISELSYDTNVFENLKTYNFQEQDEWSDIVFNEENNKFALLNKSGKTNNHLFIIKLFVKDAPLSGSTKISLKNIEASDGHNDIEFNDTSVTLNINYKGKTNASYTKIKNEIKNIFVVKTNKPFIYT